MTRAAHCPNRRTREASKGALVSYVSRGRSRFLGLAASRCDHLANSGGRSRAFDAGRISRSLQLLTAAAFEEGMK